MSGFRLGLFCFCLFFSALLIAGPDTDIKLDSHSFGGIRARMIGPAVMSGRITDIQAVESDPRIIYVATAGGGIWKSVNQGVTFRPVFDDHTLSVECVAIDPGDPDVLWAGTGECNVRNSVSVGTGLYRSTNGGKTWTYVHFKDSERISKVVVHPSDSRRVYVAVLGHLWDSHPVRGLYETRDGGKTWKRLLYVDENTGCVDLEMDPQDPRVLYAAMWQFRRWPWFFKSGGPGSGLFKSGDGGKTWRKLTRGLPGGELGRIALAVAPSRPGTLYATVEADKTALYRSRVMGEDWEMVNDTISVSMRPFYFSHLLVDPSDHNRLYVTGLFVGASSDGGKTFDFGFFGTVHSDIHALWVNPRHSHHLMVGTDGGVYTSHDRGQTFDMVASLPVSQFYHVYYDLQKPYNVYGGLQDNGSWMGPSRTYSAAGIQNKDWANVGGGDGFYVFPHPEDPDIIYWEWQGGQLARYDKKHNETRDIKPLPEKKGEPEYRFNWNAAVALSPTHPDTIYIGAQFLFRSRDRGDTWEKISPDLTTDDPDKLKQELSGGLTLDNTTAENHCTIFAIAESPRDPDVIWVGTDDGNLQLTRDGGKTWTNLVTEVPGLPPCTWCSFIEPGRFDPATAYVTFDGHRTGDMTPYVYRTSDFGKTWKSLATDTIEGYCHVVREDPVNRNLLFLGTEFGLFASIDGGGTWAHLKEALPRVSVRDMVIHPRQHDLILATHGLGIQIIDDITPLRALSPEILNAPAAVLPSRTAIMEIPTLIQEFPPDSEFKGENPGGGATITYYLKKRHIFGKLNLDILNPDGEVVQTLPTTKRKGLNRLQWGMRLKPPKAAGAPGLSMFVFEGPMVKEGVYTVRLSKGSKTFTGEITLKADESTGHSAEDRRLRRETVMNLYRLQEELGYVANTAAGLVEQCEAIMKDTRKTGVKKRLTVFKTGLDRFLEGIVQTGGIMTGDRLREKVMSLYSSVIRYGGRPTRAQLVYMSVLEEQVDAAGRRFKRLIDSRLPAVNRMLRRNKIKELTLPSREEYHREK